MQKEEFIDIANKVSEGLATDHEKYLFLYHLGTFAKENPEWEKVDPEYRQQIEDEIKSDISVQLFGENEREFKTIKLWRWVVAVAAAVALMALGVYFFNYRNVKHSYSGNLAVKDVRPGTVGATLTLSNGKKIKLSVTANGEITKEAGVSVTKTADGQLVYEIRDLSGDSDKINTLSTAKGETYILTLPDKSKVWMNAGSSLTYSATLIEQGFRTVKLHGEAYFEITKDKTHPFIVETNGQKVTVLGTHFNINSYLDETSVKTTLLEGRVRVTSTGNTERILNPGQQSILAGSKIQVVKADIEEAIAWKNGYFRFNNEDIETIMKKISRWYNIEVQYEGKIPAEGFYGKISRSKNITEVLKMLEITKVVIFKIEGRRVVVKQKY